MNEQDVMNELAAVGTEQNRKIYRRHGANEPLFGVSFANLGKLKKKIKINQALAQQLWASGNYDARILATMIADPKQMDEALLEAWSRDLSNYALTDAFVGLVAQTPRARSCMEQWINSDEEWIGRAGWGVLAHTAMQDASLPDAFFTSYLERIVRDIHSRKNWVRDAMNTALIAIGIRNEALEAAARAAATTIGKVHVDHGETNCKTPDAIAYIQKTKDRKAQRAASAR